MTGWVDIHHHILWDTDDGPRAMNDAFRMLQAAERDGIKTLIATPHLAPGRQPFDTEKVYEKVDTLNAYCGQAGLALTVYPGAEIFYTPETVSHLQSGLALALNHSRFVLTEFNVDESFEAVFNALRTLGNAGFIPILAHAERYLCLRKLPNRVHELREMMNLRIQLNCSSIVHGKGFGFRRYIKRLLNTRLVDYVATDAHNLTSRPVCMRACYDALCARYGQAYARELTMENQAELFNA